MTTTYPLHDALTLADTPFPLEADVVIAGAGIMGCAAAYYLGLRGLKAVVLDKSRIAGQQSTRAWGFVRQQGREAVEVPLVLHEARPGEEVEGLGVVERQPGVEPGEEVEILAEADRDLRGTQLGEEPGEHQISPRRSAPMVTISAASVKPRPTQQTPAHPCQSHARPASAAPAAPPMKNSPV